MFYEFLRPLAYLLCKLFFRLEVRGRENYDPDCLVLCANHTSNWDPVLAAVALPKQVHYMAKIELFKIPLLRSLIRALGAFPVDRGARDLTAIKTAYGLIADKKMVGIFPEGTRNLSGELEAKAGVVTIAVKTDAKIQPLYISPVRLFRKTRVVIGRPVYFSKAEYGRAGHEAYKELSQKLLDEIMELKDA